MLALVEAERKSSVSAEFTQSVVSLAREAREARGFSGMSCLVRFICLAV